MYHFKHRNLEVLALLAVGTGLAKYPGVLNFLMETQVNTVPRFDPLTFGEAALKLRTLRHEVLSSNMVNADTPHFKARDIDFKSVLAERLSGKAVSNAGVLARTHSGHIAPLSTAQSPSQMYRVGVQPAKDGNTVDPDIERGHFVKNAFFTEAALNFLGSTLRSRMSAITGQPS